MISAKEEIPLALRAAYLTMHRLSNARFAEHDVTADQFVLLATLARGQALTQRELASRMPSDPSTVRAMLALLEQRGLVHRDAHPTDRRARTATLTMTGRRMFQELWIAGKMIRTQMIDSMSAEEADILVRLLRQVAESLSPEDAVAGAVSSS